jgi:uncharacterized protein YbjQ (UPF0145 family)
MSGLIQFGITLGLLGLGYFVGHAREKRHLASIRRREHKVLAFEVTNLKPDPASLAAMEGRLVSGSVVISIDYFKRFASSLRNLVGGRVESLVSLTERGRREAILRMIKQARRWNAEQVVNLRLETSSISKSSQGNSVGTVEVLAYGTALRPKPPA